MADVLAPLEELPATTAALMSATLRAGQHLTVQSAERLAQRAGGLLMHCGRSGRPRSIYAFSLLVKEEVFSSSLSVSFPRFDR